MKLQELRRALSGKLWFVHGPKFNEMLAMAELFCTGGAPAPQSLSPLVPALSARTISSGGPGAVAVVPLYGMLAHRGSIWSYFFGGATVEALTEQLRGAVNDPRISAIVLDVDSPGGDVEGIDELASEIYNARKQKPITAVSNSLCASAAYYLASQASEIMVSPSSLTGSIGVYTVHEDDSRFLDNAGVAITMIKYGENKGEGNPYEPLTDPARAHLQEMVDTFGQMFDKAVARGRGVKADDVHAKFGQGRIYDAKKAVSLGLADKVGTFDDALLKHGVSRGPGGKSGRASAIREHVFVGELISDSVDASGSRVVKFKGEADEFSEPKELKERSMRQNAHGHLVDKWDFDRPDAKVWGTIHADDKKTKRVDGEDLEKSAFAYQGSDKLEDWKLPIEFSAEEKTKSHIRNAISRWSSTDMPDKDEKDKARSRIKAAAKKHGIEVDDESLALGECAIGGRTYSRQENAVAGKKKGDDDTGTNDDEYADVGDPDDNSDPDDVACACACAECVAGNCAACSDSACEDDACDAKGCPAQKAKARKAKQAIERRKLEVEAA
jgi:signal peptide peptidase SppA